MTPNQIDKANTIYLDMFNDELDDWAEDVLAKCDTRASIEDAYDNGVLSLGQRDAALWVLQ